MILQELCKLYDRLKDDPAYEIPKPGYSLQKISFIVVLKPDGTLFDIQDARIQRGKKLVPREILVPGTGKPSGSGFNPCILWDNAAYLLGFFEAKNPEKPTNDEKKKIARTPNAFEKSKEEHIALSKTITVPQFQAIARFFESWTPEKLTDELKVKLRPCAVNFGVFKILGEDRFVHEIPEITQFLEENKETPANSTKAQCLISGNFDTIAELHAPAIKGVAGAQSSGAMIVSYNWKAATSYGKENGANAPVSLESANRYCVTLNALIRNEKHRFRLGDSTVVFWTGEKTEGKSIENDFSFLLDAPSAQDETKLRHIEAFLKNLKNADTPQTALEQSGYSDSAGTPFFMLGLAPNAARLAIRFWHAGTLGKFLENLREHHRAMQIQRRNEKFNDPEFIPLWQILRQTARESDGIPPLLGGALLRSVVENLPYPQSLIQLVLNRIRIDGDISYVRASILKAFLTRNKKQKITMSLDINNTNPAYLLGRLFAVLEKTQTEAIPGLNSGIRERFYASASSTPRTVFPIMLRTFPHHLAKLDKAKEIFLSKLVQEVIDGLDAENGFPAHLNLESQGLFAIGYYQQTQAFFAKKEPAENTPSK